MSERSQPNNISPFAKLLLISCMTKFADLLVSAKTTLPWLMQSVAAPHWMIGLLVPLRESGSLLPQYLLNTTTSNISNRVTLWRLGIVVQSVSLALMSVFSIICSGWVAGAGMLVTLGSMSGARALCSLTMKDLQGELVKKGKRGRLVGTASSIAGLLSILSAIILWLGKDSFGTLVLSSMVGLASILFAVSLLCSINLVVNTPPQKTSQSEGILRALREHTSLRHLVMNRCLMLHSALVAPYFVALATEHQEAFLLPQFMASAALATFLSSYVWGKLADYSARLTLAISASIAAFSILLFYFVHTGEDVYFAVASFFVLNLAHAGVRTGRKTYLLDIAEGAKRTQFVATGNTLVGVVLLVAGGVYAFAYHWLGAAMLWLMFVGLLLGALHTVWMAAEKS